MSSVNREATTDFSEDLLLLKRGARHLAILGWINLFPGILFLTMAFVPLFWKAHRGGQQVQVVLIVLMLLGFALTMVGLFFLILRNYIQRARMWAVLISMSIAFVSLVVAGIGLAGELMPGKNAFALHRHSPWVYVVYILSHVHMMIDLVGCFGACERLAQAARNRSEEGWERQEQLSAS